jgi:hypothetical protein
MFRARQSAFLLATASMLVAGTFVAQATQPVFTANDRAAIENYYNHIIGALAPGSIDRTSFPPDIEKALAPGSKIPAQVEKQLQLLPAKLQSQLSQISGDYDRFKLGRHVVLIRRSDLTIADILKNVALKDKTN